jgi:hypothetical protein
MIEPIRFAPPSARFDPWLANELERWDAAEVAQQIDPPFLERNPFNGYERSLTARGGLLITYWDQAAGPLLDGLRVLAWTMATGMGGWLLFFKSPLPLSAAFVLFVFAAAASFCIAMLKIRVSHSIEIHPDGMIVDGRFFSIDAIGENWPALQMKGERIDRLVLCGICGTRFIEYATANRMDDNDRTPEVLAQDLEMAMEQIWSRREAIFAADL